MLWNKSLWVELLALWQLVFYLFEELLDCFPVTTLLIFPSTAYEGLTLFPHTLNNICHFPFLPFTFYSHLGVKLHLAEVCLAQP